MVTTRSEVPPKKLLSPLQLFLENGAFTVYSFCSFILLTAVWIQSISLLFTTAGLAVSLILILPAYLCLRDTFKKRGKTRMGRRVIITYCLCSVINIISYSIFSPEKNVRLALVCIVSLINILLLMSVLFKHNSTR